MVYADNPNSPKVISAPAKGSKSATCEFTMKCLSTDQPYYFAIEAFNANGVSKATVPVEVK